MRFVEEYRDARLARTLASAIRRRATRTWTIMEVCGGQTHAILQYGLDELVAPAVSLLHGPGCPVCVTPLETLDQCANQRAIESIEFQRFSAVNPLPRELLQELRRIFVRVDGHAASCLRGLVEALCIGRPDVDPGGDRARAIADGNGGLVRLRHPAREFDTVPKLQQIREHSGHQILVGL